MKDEIELKIRATKDREPVITRNENDTFNLTVSKQSITALSKIDLMKIRNIINTHLRRF